jgi:hypothetical protein
VNKKTRKRIAEIREGLEKTKIEVDGLRGEEWEKFNSVPDTLKSSVVGDAILQAAEWLDDAVSAIKEAIDNLREVEG